MPYPICRELQQQTRFFDGVLCRAEIQVNLTAGGDPKPVAAEIVSGSYFSVLGVGPALGRVIEPEDDAAFGAGPVVVLSYDFWQAQFGGAADIVGRKVLIGNHPMTVVGVAAAGFRGVDVGAVPAFWIPTSMDADANLMTKTISSTAPSAGCRSSPASAPVSPFAQAQAGLQPWFKAWLQDSTLRPGFPMLSADHRRDYLASTLELTSAPQGHSPLRQQPFPAAVAPVRRHRRSARSRLPERRRTLPRPWLCTRPRDRHSPRSRRFPRPYRPPTPRR